MEMKVGRMIQSSFSKRTNYSTNENPFSAKSGGTNRDSFTITSGTTWFSKQQLQLMAFGRSLKGTANTPGSVRIGGDPINLNDYPTRAKYNVNTLNQFCEDFNDLLTERLKNAGIPEDISFEFDYDVNSRKAVVTDISDETFRDSLQSVLDGILKTYNMDFIANGSKAMNGFMPSVYYPRISSALKRCFGQDISELYIDDDGNIGGANKNLQEALEREKRDKNFNAEDLYGFGIKQLEMVIKRLISDESAPQNISHMGYNKEGFYTSDGEARLGREIDPSLWEKASFVMRAAFSFQMTVRFDMNFWFSNEEMFN